MSVEGSNAILSRYLEEGRGSLKFVLRRTTGVLLRTSFVAIAGMSGLFWSGHFGLMELALLHILGLVGSVLGALAVLPILIGRIDSLRWKEYLRSQRA
jgi:hypothetical protein